MVLKKKLSNDSRYSERFYQRRTVVIILIITGMSILGDLVNFARYINYIDPYVFISDIIVVQA